MFQNQSIIPKDILDDNCVNRIKPSLLRDVKTEALLVFARTALEKFFVRLHESEDAFEKMSDEYREDVYTVLLKLKDALQESVVNADYLINLMKLSAQYPELKRLVKFEEPLMQYYDVMAYRVATHYKEQELVIPEFLVICVLSHWVLEEQKSTALYPFLNDIDYVTLIDKFEHNRDSLIYNDKDMVADIHAISIDVVEKLKKSSYKVNQKRVSKSRKRK